MGNKKLEQVCSIGIIGFGKMGSAIARYLELGGYGIRAYDKLHLPEKFAADMQAVAESDVVFVCVKPKDMKEVLGELEKALDESKNPLIISIAAGFCIASIESVLGNRRIIRAMPNLGARVGKSMTAFSPNSQANAQDLQVVKQLFGSFGESMQMPEELMNALTAISGSGPAYFLYLASKMKTAAIKLGFSDAQAQFLCTQTLIGTAGILEENPQNFEDIISDIKTPGGTTAAAIETFDEFGFEEAIISGVMAAQKRGEELGSK